LDLVKSIPHLRRARPLLPLLAIVLALHATARPQAPQPDEAFVIRLIDAMVEARFQAVHGFTDTEHYAVFRNSDETNPAAEMTVKTTYDKDTGKSYSIISETGSDVLRHFVLDSLLENEKRINEPANRRASWFISANYEMKLQPGGIQRIDGRDCLAVSLKPKDKAANLIEGTMWVDAKDYSTVQILGVATKSPSMFSGPAHVMRQYANLSGFAQAIHARAESDSNLFGKTIVIIDYRDYSIKTETSK
jgi:hypothetical protein